LDTGRSTTSDDVDKYTDPIKSSDDPKGLQYSGIIEDVIRQQMYSVDPDQEYSVKSDHGSGHGSGYEVTEREMEIEIQLLPLLHLHDNHL
jgi:hypothetical protein